MSELQRVPLAYLASPYTKYPAGVDQAFVDVSRIAARLMLGGINIYSPIAHCHPIAIHGNIDPLNQAFWLANQTRMMDLATVLIVAQMEGWEKSFGVAHEIEFFEKRGRAIYDCNATTLTMTRRLRKLARESATQGIAS